MQEIEITGFGNGQIFANPDRKLYKALGLTIETTEGTPAGEQKKSYNQQSRFRNALSSVWVRAELIRVLPQTIKGSVDCAAHSSPDWKTR